MPSCFISAIILSMVRARKPSSSLLWSSIDLSRSASDVMLHMATIWLIGCMMLEYTTVVQSRLSTISRTQTRIRERLICRVSSVK